jgi:hypothetical protein
MHPLVGKMIRAARLDPTVYEEVEADRGSMSEAVTVVVLSSLAAGIPVLGPMGLRGLLMMTLLTLGGWYLWALISWFIGTRVLPEPQTRADIGELLRTLGFSSAPGILRVLGVIPGLALAVNAVASVWMLASMVVAVRQALDYTSTARAVAVCVIGFVLQGVIALLLLWPMHAQ